MMRIKKPKKLFFLLLCFAMPWFIMAQGEEGTAPFWKDLTASVTIFTAAIAALISLIVAILTTNKRVKAEVEKQVKEKAKDYVDTFFEKELDVDPVTAKAFFRKLKADAEKLMATQIWIVNDAKDTDRKLLFEAIRNAGFKTPKSITDKEEKIALHPGDIMIFDGSQNLTEDQIVAFGKPLKPQAYFFYYGKGRYESEELPMRGYSNTPDTLAKRLKEVVLD